MTKMMEYEENKELSDLDLNLPGRAALGANVKCFFKFQPRRHTLAFPYF